MLYLIWLAVFVAALYLYLRQTYTVFSRHGVNSKRPVPFLGNLLPMILQSEHLSDSLAKPYFDFTEERFFGRYEFINPMIVLRDIELIKKVAVKDFENFLDRKNIFDEKADPLFGRNLLSLKGQEWKDMRSTLSPAFTSSKIRVMIPFMEEVGLQMMKSLKLKIKNAKSKYIDVDVKDMTTRYANDVIASCAFGLKVDSNMDKDNEFYLRGMESSSTLLSYIQLFKFLGFTVFPRLMKIMKITLFSRELQNFFRHLVKSTMNNREENNIIRPDMIHLLMEAKKGKLTHEKTARDEDAGFATVEETSVGKKDINRDWSDDDLTAQVIVFLIAGFETVSSVMSFMLHELAINPDIQERLYQEILENEAKTGGKFDYTSIQSMEYMDMVVSEVLRLWTPLGVIDRLCIKEYNIGPPNDKTKTDFIIPQGMGVIIPVWGIHHDPEYFPDPYKFDPERFSNENKHNIKPFTYMPFGLGPRNCIGSRFALCEVKVMVYQLMQHMELSPGEKTCIPAKLVKDTFNLKIEGGHWVRMRVRD